MYWLLTEPLMVFSKIPPFCPVALGRTQASTETAPERSSAAAGDSTTPAPPPKIAAVSPLIAPGWYVPASPLPLASAAVVAPGASPRRQYPLGRSESTCGALGPASSAPSAQLSV